MGNKLNESAFTNEDMFTKIERIVKNERTPKIKAIVIKWVNKLFVFLGMCLVALIPLTFLDMTCWSQLAVEMGICFILGWVWSYIDGMLTTVFRIYKQYQKKNE